MNETIEKKHERASAIIAVLQREYPGARCSLNYNNPIELLIATILSAQCTDERVNQVTEKLFRKYPTARHFAEANPPELEEDIRAAGLYHNKAKNIINCCRAIIDRFNGHVPDFLEGLIALNGVGRKTANVILGNAFGIPAIAVDTHVARLSRHLNLTAQKDPVKIEFDLMDIIPREHWTKFSHQLIYHGRKICKARTPRHGLCSLCYLCPAGQEAGCGR